MLKHSTNNRTGPAVKNRFILAIAVVVLYLLIKHLVPVAMIALYPIALMVTFLHEFGHAFFAFITGGSVHAVHINTDGSGFAQVAGGWQAPVLMGGYIGSAIFGNLLFYVGVLKPHSAKFVALVLALIMIFVSIAWYSSPFTTLLLIVYAGILIYISRRQQNIASYFLMIIGILSLIYIIEDYNVGPSSDIHKFSMLMPLLPEAIWKYFFLAIALAISFFNIRTILRHLRN